MLKHLRKTDTSQLCIGFMNTCTHKSTPEICSSAGYAPESVASVQLPSMSMDCCSQFHIDFSTDKLSQISIFHEFVGLSAWDIRGSEWRFKIFLEVKRFLLHVYELVAFKVCVIIVTAALCFLMSSSLSLSCTQNDGIIQKYATVMK